MDKKDIKYECELKPNPMAAMKYTLENLRAGMPFKEARAAAEERALGEGKYHGGSVMKCEIAEILAELAEEEREAAAKRTSTEARDLRRKRTDVEVEEEPASRFTQIVAPGSRVTLRKSKLAQEKRPE